MDHQQDFLQSLSRPRSVEADSLEVLNGPEDGRMFRLRPDGSVIGRLETSQVPLGLDRSVSRMHARIVAEDGRYFVEDLGSMHGTAINGRAIDGKTVLRDGDELLIGSTLLRLLRKMT